MENLRATPVRPLEVTAGKIAPHVVISIFILASLVLGFTFSTLAKNQLQASQKSIRDEAAVSSVATSVFRQPTTSSIWS